MKQFMRWLLVGTMAVSLAGCSQSEANINIGEETEKIEEVQEKQEENKSSKEGIGKEETDSVDTETFIDTKKM